MVVTSLGEEYPRLRDISKFFLISFVPTLEPGGRDHKQAPESVIAPVPLEYAERT